MLFNFVFSRLICLKLYSCVSFYGLAWYKLPGTMPGDDASGQRAMCRVDDFAKNKRLCAKYTQPFYNRFLFL